MEKSVGRWTVPLLNRFCRDVLPLMQRAANGRQTLDTAAKIVDSDRWNSFDRFADTTRILLTEYRAAGAATEVHAIPTGGPVGSGRWIIREAADIRSATVDIIAPVKQRLLDYHDCPWHVVMWSAPTPRGGVTGDLVVIDSKDELDKMKPSALRGKIVLTKLDPRRGLPFHEVAGRGARAVISDMPVPNNPNAVKWMKFGFGGVDINHAAGRIAGFMISGNRGRALRTMLEKHGTLTLRAKLDARNYIGSHDAVSGIVLGRDDPQDEVWAMSHSSEPGAIDNASGVAVCVEIARLIEGLIARGALPRPRRSIRLISGYESHSFFWVMENVWRAQPPMAGVCIDSLGAKPHMCNGRMVWHDTAGATAGFVNRLGEKIVRAGLRLGNPGYHLVRHGFVATPDTLAADPKYGFPCGYLATDTTGHGQFDAYHSSADTVDLLSARGLKTCAATMAAYLYFLADAATPELMQLATAETKHALGRLPDGRKKLPEPEARFVREQHRTNMQQLKRWMWGGDRAKTLRHLDECEQRVHEATKAASRPKRKRVSADARRVPYRKVALIPISENMPEPLAKRLNGTKLSRRVLYWADGARSLAEIAELASCDLGREIPMRQIADFFEVHAELGYVDLVRPSQMISRAQLVRDLRQTGLRAGMDVIVHSSLSAIGYVKGGAGTVIDALLDVLGKTGTLMMPSFNHGEAYVFNPMTSPTKSGAIADTMWRRPNAVRSMQDTHSVAAIGPRAEEFCAGHLEAGIWGDDSPIGRLTKTGGHILSIGVEQTSSTAYHLAEVAVGHCLEPFCNRAGVVMPDGSVREVKGLGWRDGACPVNPSKLGPALDRRKLRRHGKVGAADCTLVKAIDVWNMRCKHLKNACAKCDIVARKEHGHRYPKYLWRKQ
jgi:aminoglycoside N3'-acetyltransferase